jgi:hypothetical protein
LRRKQRRAMRRQRTRSKYIKTKYKIGKILKK